MKVLFIYSAYESIGIEILSSYLKKHGYKTDLVFIPMLFNDGYINLPKISDFFFHENFFLKKIRKSEADLIAFSSTTDTIKNDLRLAAIVKQNFNKPVIFGGIHPTVCPESVLKSGSVDYVCVGEGEKSLLELVKTLEKNLKPDIPGIFYYKNGRIVKNKPYPLINNLDLLPFPDKNLFYKKAPYLKDYYTVIASRGCPFNCHYCNNNVYRKIYPECNIFRERTPENVIDELKLALKKFNYKTVIFENDTFISGKQWTLKLLKLYRNHIKKPFICYVNPSMLDKKLAYELKKTGCINAGIGIQTLQPDIRTDFLNRIDNIEKTLEGIKFLKYYNIPFTIDHIAGIPGEDTEKTLIYLKKYLSFKPQRINYFYLTYYPGTHIFDKALNRDILDKSSADSIKNGMLPGYNQGYFFDKKTEKTFRKLAFIANWGVFFPDFFQKYITQKTLVLIPSYDFIGRILPSFIAIFFKKERFGQLLLRKYIYHFFRGGF
ncbi:MAG: radical SAM protein [Candidatus Muiribacteriota bacterium]